MLTCVCKFIDAARDTATTQTEMTKESAIINLNIFYYDQWVNETIISTYTTNLPKLHS